jgi:hypothetical protein
VNSEEQTDRRDYRIVGAAAALVSVATFLWYFFHKEILLYGDAVAHINIARRVFDSRSPGPLQLGTVWLPLPHVLMIPFVIGHRMWMSGVGGSVPSMISYVLSVIGIFRLVRGRASRTTAWIATLIFALNPNLLYMQSTAMTETVFLATFIWAVVYLDEFLRGLFPDDRSAPANLKPTQAVERCGIALAAAILTRYDGWVLAAVVGAVIALALLHVAREAGWKPFRPLSRSFVLFLILCALTPTLWLAHNYALSARPLDFLNGPYSAKAIEQRSTKPGDPPHPGTGDLKASAIFFLKASKLNVAEEKWQPFLFALALTGTVLALLRPGRFGALLLLWLPLPFYAYAVAYGSVPIFMPVWWPHSYYNVRYGLELLAAFAVFLALNFEWFRDIPVRYLRQAAAVSLIALCAGSYLQVASATPICLREARANSTSRIALERRLASILRKTPANSVILMQTGEFVGALQRAGIPIRRVIWEGDHPEWDKALTDPAGYADYIVAIEGTDVWYACRLFPENLRVVAVFDTPGKPHVEVYKSSRR